MGDRRPAGARLVLRALVWTAIVLVLVGGRTAAEALPPEAAAALDRAQRLAAEAHLTYAQHFPDQTLWREALAAGREAASLAPGAAAPMRFLGQAYTTVQWYSRAWTAWQAYLDRGGAIDAQVERQVVQVATWLGTTTFDAGRRSEALPYLETVLRFAPEDVSANERLARWHADRGAFDQALPHAEALAATGEFDALIEYVRQGARHGSAAAEAFGAAIEARHAGRLSSAMSLLATATEAAPGFAEAWREMGDLRLAVGEPEAAAVAYRRVLALVPNDPVAQSGLERAEAAIEAALPPSPAPGPDTATQPSPPPPPPPAEPPSAVAPVPPDGPTDTATQPAAPAAPTVAPAEAPVVLIDRQIEHRAASAAGSGAFTFIGTPHLQRDLRGFVTGTLYQRVEVLDKPTDANVGYQLCLVPQDITVSPACTDAARLAFSAPGAFVANQPVTSLSGATRIAWDHGITSLMLVVRDHQGAPVDDRTLVGSGERGTLVMSDYYPMTVRYQALLVPAGQAFPGWP